MTTSRCMLILVKACLSVETESMLFPILRSEKVAPAGQFECKKMSGKYLKPPVISFRSRRRPRFRNRNIEFVKPVAKQIEDECEIDDEEEVDISAVI